MQITMFILISLNGFFFIVQMMAVILFYLLQTIDIICSTLVFFFLQKFSLFQIPGGRIAELFGGKLVYGVGVLLTALFTLLSPIAAFVDFKFFIAVRVLEGLGEGVTYPAMHAMLARWIPPMERSKFAAYVYAGK